MQVYFSSYIIINYINPLFGNLGKQTHNLGNIKRWLPSQSRTQAHNMATDITLGRGGGGWDFFLIVQKQHWPI